MVAVFQLCSSSVYATLKVSVAYLSCPEYYCHLCLGSGRSVCLSVTMRFISSPQEPSHLHMVKAVLCSILTWTETCVLTVYWISQNVHFCTRVRVCCFQESVPSNVRLRVVTVPSRHPTSVRFTSVPTPVKGRTCAQWRAATELLPPPPTTRIMSASTQVRALMYGDTTNNAWKLTCFQWAVCFNNHYKAQRMLYIKTTIIQNEHHARHVRVRLWSNSMIFSYMHVLQCR